MTIKQVHLHLQYLCEYLTPMRADAIWQATPGPGHRRSIACRVKEQAEAVEYKLGLKRKLRILAEDTQRRLPQVDSLKHSPLMPS